MFTHDVNVSMYTLNFSDTIGMNLVKVKVLILMEII